MRLHALAMGLLVMCAVGCARSSAQEAEDKPELTPELKSLVLEQAPSDLPNPSYLDFGGKAQLIGYTLEPQSLAAPDSKVSLKLFWRSTGELGEGYKVYTELVTPAGKRFEVEGSGPVRKGALAPPSWEPGKIYIDELPITVPGEMEAPRFAIVVGLKTAPIAPEPPAAADSAKDDEKKSDDKPSAGSFGDVYLPVLSGLADSQHGGIIATLGTGVTPGTKRARTAKDEKRAPGALRRPSGPPGKMPASAKPREPGARPAPPAEPAK
ncbi:MAG TPA: hypothetical protein VJN18_29180 [Polyangiaceae bacterium]|nr:hypothetical protein [Polyangiaceae bacterium]